jgi:hypothetical protein
MPAIRTQDKLPAGRKAAKKVDQRARTYPHRGTAGAKKLRTEIEGGGR